MFATHPPAGERRDALQRIAGTAGRVADAELERVAGPHRLDGLQEELRRGQFDESLELFNRKLLRQPHDAAVLYARGEALRQRDLGADREQALVDLQQGARLEQAPPELFRSLGLLHRKRNENGYARTAFERYLALSPDAGDAGLIRTYMEVK